MTLRLIKYFKAILGRKAASDPTLQAFRQAKLLQLGGRSAEASRAYRTILKSDPTHWDAVSALASMLLDQGDVPGAVELYDALLDRQDDHAEAYYKRANAFNALGRWKAALADYDRTVLLRPDHANAYCNRGAALERLGRSAEALASYDRAIGLNPDDALAYYNRASVLKDLHQYAASVASYDRAIALRDDFAEAYINRGNVQQQMREFAAAIESYDRAIELSPKTPEAFHGRGLAQYELRRFDAALASYEQSITLRGDYVEAYINRGNVLQDMRRHDEAIASYDAAIALKSTYAEAYKGRGSSQLSLKRFEAAIDSFARALEIDADGKNLIGMRRYVQMQICEWRDLEADVGRLAEGLTAGKSVSPPFPVLSLLDSPSLQRLAADIWVSRECPADEHLGAIVLRPRREKIRIGYFSADFREHPVSLLAAELFELQDRSRFEITAFSFGPEANDSMRARLERAFDRFVDVRDQSEIEIASLARDLEVDIAVDLGGFTEHSRTRIFALRAAPLQMSYLGYLGTMGANYMDYLVADATIVPTSERDHYSEKIISLPSYQVNDSTRRIGATVFTRENLGLPAKGFVFSCLNSSYKINPVTFELWMRILYRVPGSSLFLCADNEIAECNLRSAASAFNIDSRRLIFGKRLALDDYLARYRAMDLFLDTLPYNAGTTASDALRAGLPVLTCMGRTFASRVASSLLNAIDLSELITSSAAEYEELAVRLATTPKLYLEIRRKLERNRDTSRLFDTAVFTKNLEDAYRQIYERLHAGLPPEHIYVGQ